MSNYDYITVEESQSINYFRIPKQLFTEEFKKLSTDAKLLYGLMLERTGLSRKNGWINNHGYVYIIYTIEEILDDLGCATEKATKHLNELKEFGLIETKRNGQGKPSYIFVKSLLKSKIKTFENRNSRTSKTENQDFRKSKCNNTEFSKTEFNNIISPIIPLEELPENQNSETIKESDKLIKVTALTTETAEAQVITPFEQFWKAYPKKVAKAAAQKAFEKIYNQKNRHQTLELIAKDLERRKHFEQWTKDQGKYIPYPATYLNGKLWLDEYQTTNTTKKGTVMDTLREIYQEEKEKENHERERINQAIWNLSS